MVSPGEYTLSRFFASIFLHGRCAAGLVPLVLLALLGGCATSGAVNPRDPFEATNRVVFDVNDGFDKAVLKPVAQAYRAVLPQPVRTGVRNFFGNLQDPWHGINNLLQGKVEDGLTDWFRFATNSTIGLGGVMDVASTMRMTKHNEDFGQTLGRLGLRERPLPRVAAVRSEHSSRWPRPHRGCLWIRGILASQTDRSTAPGGVAQLAVRPGPRQLSRRRPGSPKASSRRRRSTGIRLCATRICSVAETCSTTAIRRPSRVETRRGTPRPERAWKPSRPAGSLRTGTYNKRAQGAMAVSSAVRGPLRIQREWCSRSCRQTMRR